MTESCEDLRLDIWACWPKESSVPREILTHAAGCPGCGVVLREFRAFCGKTTAPGGEPPSWKQAIKEDRFERLRAKTLAALRTPLPRAMIWAPAMALAAAAIIMWRAGPGRGPEVPQEVLSDAVFFEQLELLENWEPGLPREISDE